MTRCMPDVMSQGIIADWRVGVDNEAANGVIELSTTVESEENDILGILGSLGGIDCQV